MSGGSNHPRDMPRILQRLLGPDGPELTCERCFELLDEYVELELAGARADEAVPGMQAHLEGCAACHEEHGGLLALVASERRTPPAPEQHDAHA